MGNSDLRKIASIEEAEYSDISNSVVSVDAYNWLYKYITVTVKWNDQSVYTTPDGMEKYPNINGILRGIPKFLKHNITPIFVFDGTPHALKEDEINNRSTKRNETQQRATKARNNGNIEKARRLDSQSQRLTPEIVSSSHELFAMLDIPTVVSPSAGEAQASYMVHTDPNIDYVLSSDYDALLFGSNKTIRNFTGRGNPEIMNFQNTLDEHNITHEQLIEAAILCGTDYNDGVYGVGPVNSLRAVTEYETISTFLDEKDESIDSIQEIKDLYLSPTVNDDWVVPNTLTPDLEAVHKYSTETIGLDGDEITPKINHLKGLYNRQNYTGTND